MSERQYVRWCRLTGIDEDIYSEAYPHPYLILWLECRRRSDMNGTLAYPEPQKGYLEQDADLLLAFEALEEVQEDRRRMEEAREKMKEEAARLFGSPSPR